ncbi:ABC transporter substrate-binding protein [Paenibacillus beijingensis]|nr:ABC transporter substrate-binding protein [Paenibacillus beijingensis]
MVVAIMFVSILGCGNKTEQQTTKPPAAAVNENTSSGDLSTTLPPPEKTDISFRLNWKIKGEFTPFYITQEKGIFSKYGLNVKVMEGSGSTPALQAVAQKNDDYAVVSTVEPSQGIAENMPVTMIASYMTKSPLVILSFPDKPIKTPKDLEGKKIVMSPTSTFTKLYDKFLETNQVDPSKITQVKLEASARNSAFLTKQADAIECFSTNELPMFEQKLGTKLEVMFAKDYGFNVAGLTLATNTEFLKENPNTTKRFLAAINEGMEFTMKNPEEATKIMKKLFPETVNEELFVNQIKRTAELLDNTNHPFGWMDENNFKSTLDILESTQLIKARKDLPAYYTNDFLPIVTK